MGWCIPGQTKPIQIVNWAGPDFLLLLFHTFSHFLTFYRQILIELRVNISGLRQIGLRDFYHSTQAWPIFLIGPNCKVQAWLKVGWDGLWAGPAHKHTYLCGTPIACWNFCVNAYKFVRNIKLYRFYFINIFNKWVWVGWHSGEASLSLQKQSATNFWL